MIRIIAAFLVLTAATCGESGANGNATVQLEGVVRVMAMGTRSETVILEDSDTGVRYAMVGERARELVPYRGRPVRVTARSVTNGWSMDPSLPKMAVIEYVVLPAEEEPEE